MNGDALVFVIDLRAAAMAEVAREVEAAKAGAFVPRVLPDEPEAPIETVALLVDEGGPLLLPIAPSRDVRWMDALARLVRFAVLHRQSVTEVAARYGHAYERSMSLPAWARGELEPAVAERLPESIRHALGA